MLKPLFEARRVSGAAQTGGGFESGAHLSTTGPMWL
jgi:hypothetical protein